MSKLDRFFLGNIPFSGAMAIVFELREDSFATSLFLISAFVSLMIFAFFGDKEK